jgi:hypothetical protein
MKDFFTAAGRKTMSVDDPLNPWSTSADILVKDSPSGFAFLCDEPYDWLPSYKRNKEDRCINLATKLRNCGQLGAFNPNNKDIDFENCTTADENEIADLAASCFMDKKSGKWKLKKEKQQPVKERFLQMGWLDRLCFRSVGSIGEVPMKFKIEEAYHWDDVPGGDQTAVEIRLTISSTNGMCSLEMNREADGVGEAPPEIVDVRDSASGEKLPSFKWLQASRSLLKQDESGVSARCPAAYHFALVPVDAEGSPLGPGDRQELTCKEAGLSTLIGAPATALKCMRYCGAPKNLDHGSREDVPYSRSPLASPFVVGSKVRYTCDSSYELSGVAEHECNADGVYGKDIGGVECLHTCTALSQMQEEMGERGEVQLQRNAMNLISNPDAVVQGDAVSFRCNGDKYVMAKAGGAEQSTIQCLESGRFDRERPKCLAKCGAPLSERSLWKSVKNLLMVVKKSSEGVSTPWESSLQVLEGDIIKFECKKGELKGVAQLRCGSDGKYGASPSKPHDGDPKCVAQCDAPSAISNGLQHSVIGIPRAGDCQICRQPWGPLLISLDCCFLQL